MPSGSTHDRITLWILPWIVCGSYLLTRHGELTLLCSGGFLFSGLMFGPDLDIYSVQFKRWGKLRWLWLPYQKLLHHRSFLSHGFILGTLIRVIYLLFWVFIVGIFTIAIMQALIGFNWNWQTFIVNQFNLIRQEHLATAIALFAGLELGAMSHYVSDVLSSVTKRTTRQKKPKAKVRKVKKSLKIK